MTHELVQLSSGELKRLQGALQAGMLSLAHADAGLLHANIAGSNNQLRSSITQCLQRWDACGGSSSALAEAIAGLMRQRETGQISSSELVWSGPEMGNGDTTRDQAIVIREMVEQVEHRLLLTTYNIAPYGFIKELLALIQLRMQEAPGLEARVVLNIPRKEHDRTAAHCLVAKFHAKKWKKLWGRSLPQPLGFYDPRSLELERQMQAVFHVKTVVADQRLLVTSANLSDNAQLHNCELGIHYPNSSYASDVWEHFDRLIQRKVLLPVAAEEPSDSLES